MVEAPVWLCASPDAKKGYSNKAALSFTTYPYSYLSRDRKRVEGFGFHKDLQSGVYRE